MCISSLLDWAFSLHSGCVYVYMPCIACHLCLMQWVPLYASACIRFVLNNRPNPIISVTPVRIPCISYSRENVHAQQSAAAVVAATAACLCVWVEFYCIRTFSFIHGSLSLFLTLSGFVLSLSIFLPQSRATRQRAQAKERISSTALTEKVALLLCVRTYNSYFSLYRARAQAKYTHFDSLTQRCLHVLVQRWWRKQSIEKEEEEVRKSKEI